MLLKVREQLLKSFIVTHFNAVTNEKKTTFEILELVCIVRINELVVVLIVIDVKTSISTLCGIDWWLAVLDRFCWLSVVE